jgi:16S rRNA processing protein RimM
VVKSINNHGAGDVIEIERDNTQSKFLPFSRDIVPVINLAEGYLTIDPPIEIDAKRSDEDSGEGLGENVSEDVDEVDSDG